MGNYDIAKKASDETIKLNNARRDFAVLKQEEEKYLKDREQKAQVRLASINKRISSANELLKNIEERLFVQVRDYKEKFIKFVNDLNSVIDRIDTTVNLVESTKKRAEKIEVLIKEKYVELTEFEEKLGLIDNNISKREKEVEKLNKQADEKLLKATKLADWANSGQRYTIHYKKKKNGLTGT